MILGKAYSYRKAIVELRLGHSTHGRPVGNSRRLETLTCALCHLIRTAHHHTGHRKTQRFLDLGVMACSLTTIAITPMPTEAGVGRGTIVHTQQSSTAAPRSLLILADIVPLTVVVVIATVLKSPSHVVLGGGNGASAARHCTRQLRGKARRAAHGRVPERGRVSRRGLRRGSRRCGAQLDGRERLESNHAAARAAGSAARGAAASTSRPG